VSLTLEANLLPVSLIPVHHRYQQHKQKKLVAKFAASVVDTGVNFAASVVDTGGNFAAGVFDTGGVP
jgi:hypothetical protein